MNFSSKSAKGSVSAEYVLIGALVAVVSIAGCFAMANGMDGITSFLFGNMDEHNKASVVAATTPVAMPNPATGSASTSPGTGGAAVDTTNNGGAGPVGITLNDGTMLNLTTVTDIKSSIETAGANGTTSLLASSMEQLTKQLLEQGKITPEEGNALYSLANQGHRIASVQAAIEAVLPEIKDGNDYESVKVEFDGNSVNFSRMIDIIGVKDPHDGGDGQELEALRSLQAKAQSSGAMSDPAVAAVVNSLVQQIYDIGDSIENIAYGVRKSEMEGTELIPKVASAQTHKSAGGICKAGKGTDTGIQCQ
ncbi:MAG: hypothetical protein VKJ04_00010 [Vampirovibrionales bacterium]|nr:hypothetical protein [Vampirovibrionales bacterium]